jgi:hypothetical protein
MTGEAEEEETEDEEPENEEDVFEWSSNGGCERCDALDGHICKEDSPRPHPNCDCTIISRSHAARSCDGSDVRYEVEHGGSVHHTGGLDPDEEFDLVFDYTIVCWGAAEQISGEVIVTRTYREDASTEPEDLIDDALAEALKQVEEIAAEECPQCPEEKLV